jgi:hypothetical protein
VPTSLLFPDVQQALCVVLHLQPPKWCQLPPWHLLRRPQMLLLLPLLLLLLQLFAACQMLLVTSLQRRQQQHSHSQTLSCSQQQQQLCRKKLQLSMRIQCLLVWSSRRLMQQE